MAIVNNFWLKGQSKKLAGAVIYQAMGQTRSRALAVEVHNPRTQSQMNQRVKWANLVNLYRANQSWMKYAFETKKASQTDYNKFMSLNVTNSNIYLTKAMAAAGGCVVRGYQITQGSLPPIETVLDNQRFGWDTNIYLGPAVEFTSVTVSSFTQMLLENNPAIQEGDQLSFIRMTQLTNQDNGVPYVIVRKYEVVLSLTNNTDLFDYLPLEYIDSTEDNDMSQLMVKDSGNAGGFVLILSRTRGGKTYVSSQRIVEANNTAIINAFSSPSALAAAIASYGDSDEPFLTSTSANFAQNVFVPNSILSLEIGQRSIVPGQFFNITKAEATQNLIVTFSSPMEGTSATLNLTYLTGGTEQTLAIFSENIDGNEINFTMPAAASLPTDGAVSKIKIGVDSTYKYEATFAVPNEYTIHGLE